VHGRAFAQQLVEGVASLHLAAQVEVLAAQPLVGVGQRGGQLRVLVGQLVGLEGALHVEAQLFGLPGLVDVAVDPALVDGADQRADVRVAGEHHADRPWVALDGALQELDAGHDRHHLVGDDQRHVLALEDLEPLGAGAGAQHPVVVLEGELQRLEDRLLVIDDENRVATGRVVRPLRPGGFDPAGRGFLGVAHGERG